MESRERETEQKDQKKKQNKLLYIILVLVLAAVLAAVFFVMGNKGDAGKEEKPKEPPAQVKEEKPEEKEPEEEKVDILAELGITVPEKELDWEALWEENEDIYGWIYIPGTPVDYPVLQHPTDNEYYLNHNLDGSAGFPGCIYSEMWNNRGFLDRNTILYGHNMDDETVFSSLLHYADEEYFNTNRYIFIYTPGGVYVYDIFAAYEHSDEHLFYSYNYVSDAGYQEYLDMVFGTRDMGAHFREGVEVTIKNRILTLSTCITPKPDKRFLVQGVLLNDPDLYGGKIE